MKERQRRGAPGRAVTGGAAAIGLCLLALASAPARAFDIGVAAEPAPQTAGEGGAPANVKPDPPPQATEQASRSSGESTQTATSVNPPTGSSPSPHAPARPEVTYAQPSEAAPPTRSVTASAPAPTHTAAARRLHPRHRRERAGPARPTVRGHHHARPPVTGAIALALASGHRHGLLLLLASLASAVLMLASLTMFRVVKRRGGTLSAGSSP